MHRMSAVRVACDADREADSVKRSKMLLSGDRSRGQQILLEAQGYYSSGYRFRKDRDRNKRYTYGDQLGDTVCVDGVMMTEEQYVRSIGQAPLQTNLIRRFVRNVVGAYRGQSLEPTCIARDRDEQQQAETMSTVLQYNMQLNRMKEMYGRSMEEYLISGLVAHKKSYGWRNNTKDCWTDYVQPNNLILDHNMRDFRGWDCSFVGEIHDVSFEDVCSFAKSPADYARIAEIYREARQVRSGMYTFGDLGYGDKSIDKTFLFPTDPTRCRVIEVWRKESKPRYRCHDYNSGDIYKIDVADYEAMVAAENAQRWEQAQRNGIPYEEVPFVRAEWFIDSYWYYYFLTPMGDILAEGETPYAHQSHPYVFKAYPFIDGEIHSFVSDVIDQQRYTNRLIMLQDWIIKASAKGVLLVPEDTLKGRDPQEFADTWTKFNGVLVYTPSKTGAVPQQIANNSTNIGIHEMLNLQLKFFEDISGVNGALQGKASFSGESGQHAQLMTQNATVSLVDILESFQSFELDAAYKDVKNIQQYYDQKRVFNIAGRVGAQVTYDPQKIRDVEMDISITSSQSTPAYRQTANDFLMQLFQAKAISVEQLLSNGDFPFGDSLLQSIKSQREQLEKGQLPDGLSPELMAQAQQGANMEAVKRLGGM